MKLYERLGAIMACRLDATSRMVLVVLADAMSTDDADRPVWLQASTVAERSGASLSTVSGAMARMEAAGIIRAEHEPGRVSRRRIDWTALQAAERPTTARGGRRGVTEHRVATPPNIGDVAQVTPPNIGEGSPNIGDPTPPNIGDHPTEHRVDPTEHRGRSVHDPPRDPPRDDPSSHPPSVLARSPDPAEPTATPSEPSQESSHVQPQQTEPHQPREEGRQAVGHAAGEEEEDPGPPCVAGSRDHRGASAAPQPPAALVAARSGAHEAAQALAADPSADAPADRPSPLTPHRPADSTAIPSQEPAMPPDDAPGPAGGPADSLLPGLRAETGVSRQKGGKGKAVKLDEDQWHGAARTLADIVEAITQQPARMMVPTAGRGEQLADVGTAIGWSRLRARLDAVVLAARGQPTLPAAVACWRLIKQDGVGRVAMLLRADGANLLRDLDAEVEDLAAGRMDVARQAPPPKLAATGGPRDRMVTGARSELDDFIRQRRSDANTIDIVEVKHGQ